MRKLQILFPEPQLDRLRRLAREEDRPVSELVRLAVDAFLARRGGPASQARQEPPAYHCGEVLTAPQDLREIAQGRTEES